MKVYLQRRSRLIALFLTTAATLFALVVISSVFRYRALQSVNLKGLNYDSRATKQPLFSVKRFVERHTGSSKAIKISLDMKAFPASASFGDVFQTAPLNKGLRLELSSTGVLSLVAATDQPPGWKLYVIAQPLEPETWHQLYIRIDPTDRIIIRFDGKPLVDAPDSELRYRISDVVVGSGFSDSRPFSGEIHNATISYHLYAANPITTSPFLRFLEVALLIVNLLTLYFLSGISPPIESQVPELL